MTETENLVQCYNRGCGQQFNPKHNTKDVCCHHPGAPVFHDAYKGWSCCKKRSVDFTEFLNIKGCTLSKHSNVKPPEPEKKALDKDLTEKEVIIVKAPMPVERKRIPFDSPLVALKPTIADAVKQQAQTYKAVSTNQADITIGTSCKNGGCGASYEGPHTNETICTHHPGVPIFHEGLKFWSCCQKRTTDFNTFLSQPGCTTGMHKWTKEGPPAGTVKCRWDWHQTPEHVFISIYAKKYDPSASYVKLNPVRLNAKLVFREEGDAAFELDLELKEEIDVARSSASMWSTKLEIKLQKVDLFYWGKLDVPRAVTQEEPKPVEKKPEPEEDDLVDLSTVEAIHSMEQVNVRG